MHHFWQFNTFLTAPCIAATACTVMVCSFSLSVLTCGDKPEIDHVTSTPSTGSPWFPGAIINYSCKDTDYQLKYNSTSECKVDGTKAKWVNQSEIRCIPGMYS